VLLALPGSRRSEIRHHMAVFGQAVARLQEQVVGFELVQVGSGFPSGQTRSVCPEIMLKSGIPEIMLKSGIERDDDWK
jgi:hypothetical protein